MSPAVTARPHPRAGPRGWAARRTAAVNTAAAAVAVVALAVPGSRAVAAEPLRVCLADDSAPYSSLTQGQPAGLDVALLDAVAQRLGRTLQPVWFEGRYDKEGNLSLDARALLAAQACELVAGVPLYAPHLAPMIADKARTPDQPGAKPLRQRPYQTLVPVVGGGAYRASAMLLIGRSGQAAASLDALRGHTVAVRAGSMASMALGAWQGGALASSLKGYTLREDVLAAVEDGAAAFALVDVALWDRHRAQRPATALAPTGYAHPVKLNIGLLARASDGELLNQVQAAIAAWMGTAPANGTPAVLASVPNATWVRPVEPAVRTSLTLRDFTDAGTAPATVGEGAHDDRAQASMRPWAQTSR